MQKTPFAGRPHPLALAARAVLALPLLAACAVPFAAHAQAGAFAPAQEAHDFDLPAGPLSTALTRAAAQAGALLSADAALTAGRDVPALQGRMTLRAALAQLLAGTGLVASMEGASIVIQAAPPAGSHESTLPTVRVTAAPAPSGQDDGKAVDGYRATGVSAVGVLGGMKLQDLPFSMSVVPAELMQNVQAQSPDDVYKLNPATRTMTGQGTGWAPMVAIRGFATYDSAEDGLRRPYNHAAALEDKERIEVLNGLSGFLYGAAAPAGMVNYVYKRPTRDRLNSVTLGNYGGQQLYVHGDFGGRLDADGRAGYRLNLVKQDGNTAIDDQKIDRTLVSAALDWQPTDRLLLELNAVHHRHKTDSPSSYWYYDAPHGAAPDPARNWSQPWIRDDFENTKLMGRMTYRLDEHLTFRGAYTRNAVDRPVQDHTMNYVGTPGEYEQIAIHSGHTKNTFDAAQALVDLKFSTGAATHTVTTGYFMQSSKDWGTTYSPNTGWTGPYPLSSPVRLPEAVYPPDTSTPYVAGRTANRNFVLGDHITFGPRWSLLVGVTRSRIKTQDFDATGARTQSDYDEARTTPSVSLLFKPLAWLTTYASYIEGLEMGGRAPDEAENRGTVMPPMVSRQKELGIKATANGMLLTAALFDIEKAYEYTAGTVYTQSGRQNHQGLEFTATGKLSAALTLLGGVTLLDAAIRGGDHDGKEPMNVAKRVAKAYAEYQLPVPGLVVTGGVFHTGAQWANETNTDRLPAYTTVDLGARYALPLDGHPVTLRLYASNLTGKRYWANSYYVGSPRSVAFSAQYRF